ncbi:MAG: FAD-dependent oxidoreductase [Clostridium sp.]|nr:FAD-dependent oxidoreductase [Clostridium sp.]
MSFGFQLDFKKDFSLNPKNALDLDVIYDVLIIGGGPSGLNAALYAKRKGLNVGIITQRKGGQLLDTSTVDNYLGMKEMSGEAMVDEFIDHVNRLEIPIKDDAEVISYLRDGEDHLLTLYSGEIFRAKTIIIATGSNPRHLGVKGEDTYAGKGVAYCAICDAPLFKNKDVFIAGGGNSAVESALDLAKVAKSVTLIHRSQFRADHILVEKLYAEPKITIHLETQILEVFGETAMKGIRVLDKKTTKTHELFADGLFIEIGHVPNLGPFEDKLALNENNEIIVDEKNHTSLDGVFAAGDVTNVPYKQIIIATSDGAKAALSANEYLNKMDSIKTVVNL